LGEFGWGYRWRDIRLADHPDRAKKLTIIIMLPISIFVALFGRTSADLDQIKMLAACAGFFGNAGISGLYSLLALAFPAEARATGSCFVIGMGLGSLLAGLVLAILEIRTN
jgi:hypothetical protein